MRDSETLLCTIFKGSREQELYVFVPKQTGAENIPDELRDRMGELKAVMNLNIGPDKKLARVDARIVLRDIHEKGYFLQLPPEITGLVLNDGD